MTRQLSLALVPLVLAACAAIDPLTAPGRWRPSAANDANLVAMLADPVDLVHGAASPEADAALAVAAVARYRAGKVKALPDSGIAQIAPMAAGAAPAATSAVVAGE